jgi:hypothetical protein
MQGRIGRQGYVVLGIGAAIFIYCIFRYGVFM